MLIKTQLFSNNGPFDSQMNSKPALTIKTGGIFFKCKFEVSTISRSKVTILVNYAQIKTQL